MLKDWFLRLSGLTEPTERKMQPHGLGPIHHTRNAYTVTAFMILAHTGTKFISGISPEILMPCPPYCAGRDSAHNSASFQARLAADGRTQRAANRTSAEGACPPPPQPPEDWTNHRPWVAPPPRQKTWHRQ